VEIQNISGFDIDVLVVAHDMTGAQTASETYPLAARTGRHIEASTLVPNGMSGVLQITASIDNSITAQSMFYFRDTSGHIDAMYGTQGGETIGGTRWGSWNLFLGMSNWLRVFNISPNDGMLQLTVYNGTQTVYDEVLDIDGSSGFDLGLHEITKYGTNSDNYGLVRIKGDSLMTQLLRLRPGSGGAQFDFAAPTPVRR
jgi:hypothetical protein